MDSRFGGFLLNYVSRVKCAEPVAGTACLWDDDPEAKTRELSGLLGRPVLSFSDRGDIRLVTPGHNNATAFRTSTAMCDSFTYMAYGFLRLLHPECSVSLRLHVSITVVSNFRARCGTIPMVQIEPSMYDDTIPFLLFSGLPMRGMVDRVKAIVEDNAPIIPEGDGEVLSEHLRSRDTYLRNAVLYSAHRESKEGLTSPIVRYHVGDSDIRAILILCSDSEAHRIGWYAHRGFYAKMLGHVIDAIACGSRRRLCVVPVDPKSPPPGMCEALRAKGAVCSQEGNNVIACLDGEIEEALVRSGDYVESDLAKECPDIVEDSFTNAVANIAIDEAVREDGTLGRISCCAHIIPVVASVVATRFGRGRAPEFAGVGKEPAQITVYVREGAEKEGLEIGPIVGAAVGGAGSAQGGAGHGGDTGSA